MTPYPLTEDLFENRHIGPTQGEEREMLAAIGVASVDELIDQTVPAHIRLSAPLHLPGPESETRFLQHIRGIAAKNRIFRSYIGLGYADCITPTVIVRNVLENPGWYTQYTPYQAEISQGRLEAMLNFQTMVVDLTGMEVANASLLDEGTAAAEAMQMMHAVVHRSAARKASEKFFVSDTVLPQTIAVLRSRALPLGFEIEVGDFRAVTLDASYFGALVQYPAQDGQVHDYRGFVEAAHSAGVPVVVAADLMSLVLLTPPGEWGADVVVGSSQRFGIPMGFGGPHAAFFATKSEYIRMMPGRIIGVSVDAQGNPAYRMTLQTREQHIRREKATSNICTAQALLATMAGLYAVYHGPSGLRRIARNIHTAAVLVAKGCTALGFTQEHATYFDTVVIRVPDAEALHAAACEAGVNFRRIDATRVGVAVDETTGEDEVHRILAIFAAVAGKPAPRPEITDEDLALPASFARTSDFLTHPVFNQNRAETEFLRYIKRLEAKDLSLTFSMTPLGSCTMKLNATTELIPITWPEFAAIHPFAPSDQVEGSVQVAKELGEYLCAITGFAATSFQPNSGAQGEYTGLRVIRAWHESRGEGHRNVTLIPASAHGTNPASAIMAGYAVVVVNCDARGNIDVEDLKAKAAQHADHLAALLVTYPSTHGVFEESIAELCDVIHRHGGQVYMDGANLNAQVGLTSPVTIGADVCHINLHKTFSIPHGGGGPGMGPICVASHLAPFLPGHVVTGEGEGRAIDAVSSAQYGSASILPISYGYVRMLGAAGCTAASRYAILNANYLKAKLEPHFPILYAGANGRVAHEFIVDLHDIKMQHSVEAEDVAKRLMDYGFHAPTVAFPVHDTLMIEPTESESKAELDRFAEALISIREEIQKIADGDWPKDDNPLKNAPHTAAVIAVETWTHPYTREQAVFPLPWVKANKFWPPVARVNNSHGDRNIFCTCPPMDAYR